MASNYYYENAKERFLKINLVLQFGLFCDFFKNLIGAILYFEIFIINLDTGCTKAPDFKLITLILSIFCRNRCNVFNFDTFPVFTLQFWRSAF